MSTTAEPDTSASDDFDEDPPAEPAGSSDILLGAGQSMWLGLITVGTILALILSVVAIVMSRSEGGSGGGGGDAGPTSDLALSAVEFAFEPDTWTIVADTEASVTMTNDGAVEHNWSVLESGVTISSEADFDPAAVVAATDDIAGGESGTAAVTLPAGTYQVICTIAGHFDSGMAGTLTAA